MAIERLRKDMHCSECGALLKAGTVAKVYRKRDGTVLVYGFNCHSRKVENSEKADQNSQETKEVSTEGWVNELNNEAFLKEVYTIRELLQQILDVLVGAREKLINEGSSRKGLRKGG